MKNYTKVAQKQFDQVKTENLNANNKDTVATFNGKLDAQNMPVKSLSRQKMENGKIISTSTVHRYGFSWLGQSQDYHFVRRWTTYEGGNNISLPIYTFDLYNKEWRSGWNNATEIHSSFADFTLDFIGESGMLHGCADINFRHGTDIMQDKNNVHVEFSDGWWTRWGIFVNDVLVAETNKLYPRLENIIFPYKIPCGSQPIRIELKWQTITTSAYPELEVTTQPYSRMEIYGLSIWCCNTRR